MNPSSWAALSGLALRFPVATVSQLARFLDMEPRAVQDVMKALAAEGRVVRRRALVNPPQPLGIKVADFPRPYGERPSRPNFGKLSTLLHSREPEPAEELTIIWATTKAAAMFGGASPDIDLAQLAHDLQGIEIFLSVYCSGGALRRLARGVDESPTWLGEHVLRARVLSIGKYIPDAAHVATEGGVRKIVRAFEIRPIQRRTARTDLERV
jgi:hypothetical protein